MGRGHGLRLGVAWLAMTLPVWCQAPSTSPTTTFKSRTDLVMIPTVVTRAKGVHVSGLKKGDFTVLEDGEPQRITVFEEVETSNKPLQRVPHGTNEYSNGISSEGGPGRVTILLLDTLNTTWANNIYARDMLFKYLASIANKNEPTALAVLDGRGLHMVHDFDTDPQVLAAALRALGQRVRPRDEVTAAGSPENDTRRRQAETDRPGTESDWSRNASSPQDLLAQEIARMGAFQHEMLQEFAASSICDELKMTAESMQMLGRAYAGLPGRKALVWITEASFVEQVSLPALRAQGGDPSADVAGNGWCGRGDLLDRAWRALADAQISVYPVSPVGLLAPTGGNATQRNSMLTYWAEIGPMKDLAAQTGGKAFYGRNDIETGFREAAEDSKQYYLIGYYRKGAATPGWHKLKLTVRDAKLKVRARAGFFAAGPEPIPNSQLDADFALATAAPLDFTGLPFKLSLGNTEPLDAGQKLLRFRVVVAPGPLAIDESDDHHVLLEIAMLAVPRGGGASVRVTRNLEANFSPAELRELRVEGLNCDSEIELDPGEYTLRAIVHDRISGKIGTVSFRYTVK